MSEYGNNTAGNMPDYLATTARRLSRAAERLATAANFLGYDLEEMVENSRDPETRTATESIATAAKTIREQSMRRENLAKQELALGAVKEIAADILERFARLRNAQAKDPGSLAMIVPRHLMTQIDHELDYPTDNILFWKNILTTAPHETMIKIVTQTYIHPNTDRSKYSNYQASIENILTSTINDPALGINNTIDTYTQRIGIKDLEINDLDRKNLLKTYGQADFISIVGVRSRRESCESP